MLIWDAVRVGRPAWAAPFWSRSWRVRVAFPDCGPHAV